MTSDCWVCDENDNCTIDHYLTEDIVCPYCGWVDDESYLCDDEYQEWECPECGEEFDVVREVDIKYKTMKRKVESDG